MFWPNLRLSNSISLPLGPGDPTEPGPPGGPKSPVAPVLPGYPTGPNGPGNPRGPRDPAGPTLPGAPRNPGSPLLPRITQTVTFNIYTLKSISKGNYLCLFYEYVGVVEKSLSANLWILVVLAHLENPGYREDQLYLVHREVR